MFSGALAAGSIYVASCRIADTTFRELTPSERPQIPHADTTELLGDHRKAATRDHLKTGQ
jgi:hypothetical protein